jgi:hypothetical protein
VQLLKHLGTSMRRFGAQLTERQVGALRELVRTSRGRLADAAAEAFGAGNMPTQISTELSTR